MKISFEKLSAHLVEEWQHHPGTQHLVAQLVEAERHWVKRMVADSIASAYPVTVAGHGGRCAEIRQIIDDIKDAKGSMPEGEK